MSRRVRWRLGSLTLFPTAALVACVAPETGRMGVQNAPADEPEAQGTPLRGSWSTRFRAREGDGDDDQDLFGVLALEVGDSDRQRVTGSLLARFAYDVDGDQDPDDAFADLRDADGGRFDAQVYHAWADVHGIDALDTLRFGRQLLYQTPEFAWFDGAHIASEPRGARRWQWGLYGGVPVRLYEDSTSGDLLAGGYVTGRPWSGTRARLDWMHIEDETVFDDDENDLLGLGIWQSVGDELNLEGEVSHLESRTRDARLAATWLPDENFMLRVSHYRLLATQRDRTLEADPFFDSLRALFPFDQSQLLVTKNLGESTIVDGGVDLRRVDDEDDVGEFNRDFDRFFLTTTFVEALPSDVTLSLSGERWDGGGNDVDSLGADLSKDLGEGREVGCGTYYALFKYDLFLDSERDDVRTYYARWRRRGREGWTFDVLYELDRDDADTYHNLRLVATWQF